MLAPRLLRVSDVVLAIREWKLVSSVRMILLLHDFKGEDS
jgi:hypothetical protein